MPQLMLVNPAKRRRARKSAAPRRARRGRARRRSNPITSVTVRRRARRAVSPHRSRTRRVIRRRRNPISMRGLSGGSFMKILKSAAIGGAGSIAFDMLMAQVRKYLPPSLQPSATGPGLYDALYVVGAVLLGRGLSKSTRGLSEQMAAGALTVKAAQLMAPLVAKAMPAAVAGVGYMSPNRVIPMSARVSPGQVAAYTRPGSGTPLLSAYVPGRSPLLSGARMGNAYAGHRAR